MFYAKNITITLLCKFLNVMIIFSALTVFPDYLLCSQQDSKEKILGRVFSNLSKPPSYTVIRINTLQISIEEAKLSLQKYLKQV